MFGFLCVHVCVGRGVVGGHRVPTPIARHALTNTPTHPHRMEITELLSEVRVEGAGPGAPSPSKRQRALQGFLFALRDLLLGLPKGVGDFFGGRLFVVGIVSNRMRRGPSQPPPPSQTPPIPPQEMPETPENTQAFPFTPHAQWGDVKAQGKGRLAFAPPKGVEVVGSFMLPGAICKPVRRCVLLVCAGGSTDWLRLRHPPKT